MLGTGLGMMELWKNGTMSNELASNSMIHFVCFYLKFFHKPRTNIPVFQYSFFYDPVFHPSSIPSFPLALFRGPWFISITT
jgi:hypothetical protein